MTALHWACRNGHTGTAELLIAKGADVKAKDDVSQGDKGGWRGVERACPDSDSHRWSRIKRKAVFGLGLASEDGCRLEA